uniref:Protein FAM136A n=1 Tax=Panagrellus redivivus TaxID=6233 RepID=A0A7E4ZZN8_PANRE
MEDTQKRVKTAIDGLLNDLDRTILREKQRQTYLCSADCCKTSGPRSQIESCVDVCNKPLQKAQVSLERELGGLQEQLSRCAMTCYDKLVQQMGPNPDKYSEAQMHTFNEKIDKCVSVCADTHIQLLPGIKDRLTKELK